MVLRPDLSRTVLAIREQHADWERTAGETLTIPRGAGKSDGHPVLAEPCRCGCNVTDEGRCCKCGRDTL